MPNGSACGPDWSAPSGGLSYSEPTTGAIGSACIRELADAIALGVWVAGFDLGRGLGEISGLDLIDMGSRSARRTATLRLGRCVSRQHGTGGLYVGSARRSEGHP